MLFKQRENLQNYLSARLGNLSNYHPLSGVDYEKATDIAYSWSEVLFDLDIKTKSLIDNGIYNSIYCESFPSLGEFIAKCLERRSRDVTDFKIATAIARSNNLPRFNDKKESPDDFITRVSLSCKGGGE